LRDDVEISLNNPSPAIGELTLSWISWEFINVSKFPSLGDLSTSCRPLSNVVTADLVLEDLTLVVDNLVSSPSVELPPSGFDSSIISSPSTSTIRLDFKGVLRQGLGSDGLGYLVKHELLVLDWWVNKSHGSDVTSVVCCILELVGLWHQNEWSVNE
jgi:hypothetical protein